MSNTGFVSTCRECLEDFYSDDLNDEMVCNGCEFGSGCEMPLPSGVTVGFSHFAGTFRAVCDRCSFMSVYWECACDLRHDCSERQGN